MEKIKVMELSMQIIAFAGMGKSLLVDILNSGLDEVDEDKLKEAEEYIVKAHEIQFQELMTAEVQGEDVPFSLVLVHAMDILADTANLLEEVKIKNKHKQRNINNQISRLLEKYENYDKKETFWGKEYKFLMNDYFVCRLLHVKSGEAVSLQYHKEQIELLYVLSGSGIYYKQLPGKRMTEERISKGDVMINYPYEIHRQRAISDLIMLEVSTVNLQDIIRVEDDYGRSSENAWDEWHDITSKIIE